MDIVRPPLLENCRAAFAVACTELAMRSSRIFVRHASAAQPVGFLAALGFAMSRFTSPNSVKSFCYILSEANGTELITAAPTAYTDPAFVVQR